MRLLVLATLVVANDLSAQTNRDGNADCDASAPAPADLAGGAARTPVTAATTRQELDHAVLTLDRGVDAILHPMTGVEYAIVPERPGEADGHGGMFVFDVPDAGRYRVAVGTPAWVDVVEDGRMIASAGHSRGADCSDVHKVVIFALQPGRHLLQVSGNAGATTILLITAAP